MRTLRRELDLHHLVRRTLHRFTEATPLLRRLCVGQPRVLFLGLRALLTAGLSRSAG